MRIEHSRKHGPFDPRRPALRDAPAPASLWHLGEERLDWQEFHARYFAHSRRHAFHALATYTSYLDDSEGSPAHAVWSDTTQRRDNAEEPASTPDTDRWESEGGASAPRRRRPRTGGRPVGTQAV